MGYKQNTYLKPMNGVLNRSHPFVRNLYLALLLNEGSGSGGVKDHSQYYHFPAVPGSSTIADWVPGRGGPALGFNGGGKELRFTPRSNYFTNIQNAFSVFAFSFNPVATAATYFSTGEQTDSNDIQTLGIDQSSGKLCIGQPNGSPTVSTLLVPAIWCGVGVSQTASNARNFVVGQTVASNAAALGSSTIGTGQPMSLGRTYVNSVVSPTADFTGKIEVLLVWKVGVPVWWLQSLSADPYQMWMSPSTPLVKSSVAVTKRFNPAYARNNNQFMGIMAGT